MKRETIGAHGKRGNDMTTGKMSVLWCALLALGSTAIGVAAEARWDMSFKTFFSNGTTPLYAYAQARDGKSGAAYYAQGIGNVRPDEQAAMKWCYEKFLLDADIKSGCPYDTASRDPNYTVCAFVNWPTDMAAKDANEVLPKCYQDTIQGFVAWRNRWQDGNDAVLSVLLEATQGYMGAKPDGVTISAYGQKVKWGEVSGKAKYWWQSPMGETSVLTSGNGASTAVDFSKASGADVMLVTTGKADGLPLQVGGKTLTVKFFTEGAAPTPTVEGNALVVGKQRVTVSPEGNLVLAVAGK